MSDFLDIHALADGQLEGEAKLQAEERLRTDPASNAEYHAVLSLDSALRQLGDVVTGDS
jgi:anti-sigma factor RsiW